MDRKRIYLIGHSAGGYMAYRMACDSADLIAGIVSLAGTTFSDPSQCIPSEPVNILQIHGTRDQIIAYAGLGNTEPPYTAPSPGALQTVQIWAGYNGATGLLTDLRPTMNLDLAVSGLDTIIMRYTNAPPSKGWTRIGTMNRANVVAQTSKSAVSRVSKPAPRLPVPASSFSGAQPTWKSAIQQVWKPALQQRG